jgi:hypothetical protein
MNPPHEPEKEHQGMDRKHLTSPVKEKFKTQPSAGESDVDTFLGLTRTNPGTPSREGHNSQQCDSGIRQDQVRPAV